MKTRIAVATLTTVSMVLGWGCTTVDERLAIVAPPPPPSFAAVDAGPDAEPGLVPYCPTNKCPPGRVTCPNSRFPCDVDLRTDVNNCGACGHACPRGALDTFVCTEGACALACGPRTLDCDGLSDNGREIGILDNNHRGGCGNKCTDPDKPCMFQDQQQTFAACGCPVGLIYCAGMCRDPNNDAQYCGACGVTCNPVDAGDDVNYPNRAYGCNGGVCGVLCKQGYGDCNGERADGCEVDISTAENCGACGNVCPANQQCRVNAETRLHECMCPSGLTYCQDSCLGSLCVGRCIDLTSDLANCGACGASCGSNSRCSYGACEPQCPQGAADCNNSTVDGCEVSTDSDPRNCGGCGRVCDAVAGQACVAGRCVVEPCSEGDAGGFAR
ncbi:MAG: hypothetical protein J0I07_16190 [Myxococcales bacterium]|nr:hypothetical protein [Myxococcales bacterium]